MGVVAAVVIATVAILIGLRSTRFGRQFRAPAVELGIVLFSGRLEFSNEHIESVEVGAHPTPGGLHAPANLPTQAALGRRHLDLQSGGGECVCEPFRRLLLRHKKERVEGDDCRSSWLVAKETQWPYVS